MYFCVNGDIFSLACEKKYKKIQKNQNKMKTPVGFLNPVPSVERALLRVQNRADANYPWPLENKKDVYTKINL